MGPDIYVYMYTYMSVHTYIHTYIYIYVCMYECMYVHLIGKYNHKVLSLQIFKYGF
ncbi:MAG: hypothetical protein NW900_01740 [Candidatus Blochmannia sp. A2]|nr:hypothetical protein [Candidatus Blochmannia sp. A2]